MTENKTLKEYLKAVNEINPDTRVVITLEDGSDFNLPIVKKPIPSDIAIALFNHCELVEANLRGYTKVDGTNDEVIADCIIRIKEDNTELESVDTKSISIVGRKEPFDFSSIDNIVIDISCDVVDFTSDIDAKIKVHEALESLLHDYNEEICHSAVLSNYVDITKNDFRYNIKIVLTINSCEYPDEYKDNLKRLEHHAESFYSLSHHIENTRVEVHTTRGIAPVSSIKENIPKKDTLHTITIEIGGSTTTGNLYEVLSEVQDKFYNDHIELFVCEDVVEPVSTYIIFDDEPSHGQEQKGHISMTLTATEQYPDEYMQFFKDFEDGIVSIDDLVTDIPLDHPYIEVKIF